MLIIVLNRYIEIDLHNDWSKNSWGGNENGIFEYPLRFFVTPVFAMSAGGVHSGNVYFTAPVAVSTTITFFMSNNVLIDAR